MFRRLLLALCELLSGIALQFDSERPGHMASPRDFLPWEETEREGEKEKEKERGDEEKFEGPRKFKETRQTHM